MELQKGETMIMAYTHPENNPQVFAFGSNMQSIDSLEFLLDEIKEEMAISDELHRCIWIVLSEAVANAILHGNRCSKDKKVSLSIHVEEDKLCFVVSDEGQGFDPSSIPDPTSPERILEPTGRGVFLINKLADSVTWLDNGTRVEICFWLNKER